ncbi:MAG: aminoacyl-tRNA hydrolase [Deltaproteobacteria bacterium]|nr:aminoacyl-tRNA hydrolase [Deltaproteobacteria bacterium]
MLHVNASIAIPDTELEFSVARSSGPGGQNVNKVNSKVVLRWNARMSTSLPLGVRVRFMQLFASRLTNDGEVIIASDRHRDQPMNREDCLEKLRALILEAAVPPKPRRKTKPSRSSRENRKESKRSRGSVKKMRGRVRGDD